MKFRILYAGLLLMVITLPAAAQQPFPQAPAPAQPAYVPPPATAFPQLPPSRACATQDLPGIWKLHRVYEAPLGTEMTAFLANPVQYILFDANSTYSKYNAGQTEIPPASIRGEITQHTSGLQQYVVDASGFVFFYQDGKAIDTQACFIVANPLGQFQAGQLLMMPPEGTIQGRLVKVYVRINEQQPGRGRGRGRGRGQQRR